MVNIMINFIAIDMNGPSRSAIASTMAGCRNPTKHTKAEQKRKRDHEEMVKTTMNDWDGARGHAMPLKRRKVAGSNSGDAKESS